MRWKSLAIFLGFAAALAAAGFGWSRAAAGGYEEWPALGQLALAVFNPSGQTPVNAAPAAPQDRRALSVVSDGGGTISMSIGPIVRPMFFTRQTIRGASGFGLGYQPVIALKDGAGNVVVTDNTSVVTLSIAAGTGATNAVLSCGPNDVTVVQGIATFSGCRIDRAGLGYVLQATTPGFNVGQTAPFNITLAGDTNGDCRVSIVDFSWLVSNFGKNSNSPGWTAPNASAVPPFAADLNGDGTVSIQDFSILVTKFGTTAATCAPASNGSPVL